MWGDVSGFGAFLEHPASLSMASQTGCEKHETYKEPYELRHKKNGMVCVIKAIFMLKFNAA